MTEIRSRRSVLSCRAPTPVRWTRRSTLPADGLILDLEDAVAPGRQGDGAEAGVRRGDAQGGYGAREVMVRVNAPGNGLGRGGPRGGRAGRRRTRY